MNSEAATNPVEIAVLASTLVEEIQELFIKAEALPMRFMSAFTQTQSEDVKLYVRVFSSQHGHSRYIKTLGMQALNRQGRVLVISNVEFAPSLQSRGLLKAIVREAVARIEDLDIIEFENVLSAKLASDLAHHGYVLRDSTIPFGSLYKTMR
ncbi:hypothetical protein P245_20275 [Comamonas thiooxydans]|uniref:N-acetyltransferase domain-containing protein n=1 Tax=Comamonas thiooxydans TaxID=363952 RepID=A0A0E3BY64_9BURK|nr:hypothetical protein [Comamonas thiooxydans]KGG87402.1 hypothetical protein P245_20275 [Comamonas thiooxydans]